MEESARADSPSIKPINKGVVHRICAGQVILDLSSAVKELVENSLDAGATSIEVVLKDYGEESFKVIDNGCGISPHNFKILALKHHTSKLVDFPDLQSLATFGFRGEALSSLCALGKLTVETRTKNEPVATHLTFEHSGLLINEKKLARQVGTTVTVERLFSSLPVRSKEFSRNIRKEYGKLLSLLNAYALIAKGVRLVCTNTTGKNNKSVVLKTQGSSSIKDNIITVFGMNTFNCLEPLNTNISDSCMVEGFISKPGHGSGRNLGDRQFFFVNNRPVDMPKVSKVMNELYKCSNPKQYPIAVMNFKVPTRAYDVNVTPDKRKIFFSDEGSLIVSLKEAIEKIYSPSHRSFCANILLESKNEEESSPFELSHANEGSHLPVKHLSPGSSGHKKAKCDDGQLAQQKVEDDEPLKEVNNCTPASIIKGSMAYVKEINPRQNDFTLRLHSVRKELSSPGYQSSKTRFSSNISPLPFRSFKKDASENAVSSSHSSFVQSSLTNFLIVNKRKVENSAAFLSEVPVLRNSIDHCKVRKTSSEMDAAVLRSHVDHQPIDDSKKIIIKDSKCHIEDVFNEVETPISAAVEVRERCQTDYGAFLQEVPEKSDKSTPLADVVIDDFSDKGLGNTSEDVSNVASIEQSTNVTTDAPMQPFVQITLSVLQFSIKELAMSREKRLSRLKSHALSSTTNMPKRKYNAATLEHSQPENEERKVKALIAATSELERFFNKEDFGRVKVIGQFNLGFIIGRLDQDLFIIDQHAADEKYNFERLSQSTILNQQPLLLPMRLELSPEEEIVASMHMDIIRKNGFTLMEDVDAPPGHHFKLKAVPFSKNITFGADDVKELISTLADSQGECSIISSYKMDTTDSICPSRVRAMLASRACRSSVMIGDALGRNEMEKILQHLVGLRSPWNCPHGRPTMRHLVDLTTMYNKEDLE
ncbi:hypothetical protein Syun_028813 [Stephania yunnanensis]|uniref:DNA mismatch repair protein PMS1 n=1 Tax=Stephania yunnanensis TaxID=152371 RepID=A0AAP0E4G8_9MAGN